jgi:hypothetical protein
LSPIEPVGIVIGENELNVYQALVFVSHVGVIAELAIVYVVGEHDDNVQPSQLYVIVYPIVSHFVPLQLYQLLQLT